MKKNTTQRRAGCSSVIFYVINNEVFKLIVIWKKLIIYRYTVIFKYRKWGAQQGLENVFSHRRVFDFAL